MLYDEDETEETMATKRSRSNKYKAVRKAIRRNGKKVMTTVYKLRAKAKAKKRK